MSLGSSFLVPTIRQPHENAGNQTKRENELDTLESQQPKTSQIAEEIARTDIDGNSSQEDLQDEDPKMSKNVSKVGRRKSQMQMPSRNIELKAGPTMKSNEEQNAPGNNMELDAGFGDKALLMVYQSQGDE